MFIPNKNVYIAVVYVTLSSWTYDIVAAGGRHRPLGLRRSSPSNSKWTICAAMNTENRLNFLDDKFHCQNFHSRTEIAMW